MITTPESKAFRYAGRDEQRRVSKSLPHVWPRERTSSDRSFLARRADRALIRRPGPPVLECQFLKPKVLRTILWPLL
jgi:hypothetical protein